MKFGFVFKSLISSLAFILFSAGCSRNDSQQSALKASGVYVGDKSAYLADLGKNDVFLKVNGKCFTKADYELDVSVYDKMLRMAHKAPLTGFSAQSEEALHKMRPFILSLMPRRELIKEFAESKGVKADDVSLKKVVGRVLKEMNRSHSNLDSVCSEMGKEIGERFRYFVDTEALEASLRNYFDNEKKLDVKEEDVISYSNRYEKSVIAAKEANAKQLEKMNKALGELSAGADFEATAVKYCDSKDAKEEAGYWDEYYIEDFEDEDALGEWAMSAKEGDVSGILEMEDGYSIVKLIKVTDEITDPDDDTKTEKLWTFGRMRLDVYDSLMELKHDEIVDAIYKERSAKLQKIVGAEIMKNAVIEWPYGTNLFDKAVN